MKNLNKLILTGLFVSTVTGVSAHELVVNAGKKGAEIPSTMYGLFFEDINYGADGGLYAELVKNRSFEFPQNLMGWKVYGNVEMKNDGPFERNPHYVRLSTSGHREKWTGLENEGFFGMGFKKGEKYRFSVWARLVDGEKSEIRVVLTDPASMNDSQDLASEKFTVDSKDWKKYTVTLTPHSTIDKGSLRLFLTHPDNNVVDLEHISLFPEDTYNGHENGLRKDLAEKLADLKPGVFRFPGGCIVEGTQLPDRYQWKNTVGPVENRPTNQNRWHYTFPWRFYPDYYQSGGLGFYEYFLLSEELGASPLPVLNVGLACQYQNNSEEARVAVDSLDEYIQDALDLVEFANGDTSTKWGALRAEMGHPEPFGLKYLAIGNEQWGPEYVERLKPFVEVLNKKCPEIKIIGSSGPDSEGDKFDYLWPEMRKLGVDLVDEHFYRNEDWFKNSAARYDKYPRKGPKVFAGEYACHPKGKKFNQFKAALHEAAFMTGLERNADVVAMATYAPLFAHVEGWQWRPDMIWYDNLRSMPTGSYLVQQLYSLNKGNRVVPVTLDGKAAVGAEDQSGLYASGVYENNGDYIVKVANLSETPQPLDIKFKGLKKSDKLSNVKIETFASDNMEAENTLDNQEILKILTTEEGMTGDSFSTTIAPGSFAVYRFSK